MTQTGDGKNPRALFDTITQELAALYQAAPGKMFSMACIKIDGKVFAGFWRDGMVFKLAGETHQQAIGLEGSKLFDPGGQCHPMKEWVVVTFAHAKDWHHYAEEALGYVKSLKKSK